MGINFPTRSQTKIGSTKAVTHPRHFFVDGGKKNEGSGEKIVRTSKTMTTHPNYE